MQGKYVVLFFYPLDFTFVCPTEITAFSDRHGDFEKLNAEVCGVVQFHMLLPPCIQLLGPSPNFSEINDAATLRIATKAFHLYNVALQVLGVSVDSQFSHLAWCQTGMHFAKSQVLPVPTPAALHSLSVHRPCRQKRGRSW